MRYNILSEEAHNLVDKSVILKLCIKVPQVSVTNSQVATGYFTFLKETIWHLSDTMWIITSRLFGPYYLISGTVRRFFCPSYAMKKPHRDRKFRNLWNKNKTSTFNYSLSRAIIYICRVQGMNTNGATSLLLSFPITAPTFVEWHPCVWTCQLYTQALCILSPTAIVASPWPLERASQR